MSKKKSTEPRGAMAKLLSTEKFFALASMLQEWRADPVMRQMEKDRDEGRILGFVKGLRLSAQLAYIVRDALSEKHAQVSWGHLVDDTGRLCSPECDIIIHKPGYLQRWNGDGGAEPIMDFRFIRSTNAFAVISCKSFVNNVDKDYCKGFANYGVENILLFAECCNESQASNLENAAARAGYRGFYYLYMLAKHGIMKQDPEVYSSFIEEIDSLVS